MKKFIQLKSEGAQQGLCVIDTDYISELDALALIKESKKEHGDSSEDFMLALGSYGIKAVEPDMVLHLEDLNRDDIDVQLHPVQYKTKNNPPSLELFVVGQKANQCRTAWEGDYFSICNSQPEIEALKCVHNPHHYFIV